VDVPGAADRRPGGARPPAESPRVRRRRRTETLRAAIAAALLVAVTVWAWAGLWVDAPAARLVVAALLGSLPAVTIAVERGLRARLLLFVTWLVSAVIVVGVATDVSIRSLLGLRASAWSTVWDLLDHGLSVAATVAIPLQGVDIRPITALLIIVIATTTSALVALAFAARRAVPAVLGAVIAIAYRWTLVPPSRPIVDGLAVLAVALVVIALLRPAGRSGSHPLRTAVTGAAVVGVAALSGLGVWGSGAWWDWQNWSWGNDTAGATVLSTSQSYGPLEYRPEPVEVARVRTTRRAALKAVTLSRFDGISFTEDLDAIGDVPVRDGRADIFARFGARGGAVEEVVQDVSLTGTRSRWVMTAGNVRSVERLGDRDAVLFADGSLQVDPELERGSDYRFRSVFVDPGSDALLRTTPYDPSAIDEQMTSIAPGQGLPTVTVPLFGSGGPQPDPEQFGPYADVYRLSREIVGDARTPYEAVNRIERYLRQPPFTYDLTVERPVGRPDLAVFLLEDKRGYCQQFAGAMGLMLRMNGIPARVAVGFNVRGDTYNPNDRTFQVVDRDAHSWVEVAFPGYGWLPFDPTPGRSAPNSASVSAPDYQPPAQLDDPATDLASEPVDPAPETPEDPAADPAPEDPVADPVPVADRAADGPAWAAIAGIVAAVILLVGSPVIAKTIRRTLRRRGDERERVLGAVREIESLMTDLGRPPDPTATGQERSAAARRDLGIDAERIYRLAGAARFGDGQPSARAAREAWDDVRRARRSLPLRTRIAADLRPGSFIRPRS